MNSENWKTITRFPNYEVSDHGNVRVKETKYIMKPFTNEAGYLRISITNITCKRKNFIFKDLLLMNFCQILKINKL